MNALQGSVPEWLTLAMSIVAMLVGVGAAWSAFRTSVKDQFSIVHSRIRSTHNELSARIDNQQQDINDLKKAINKMCDDVVEVKIMLSRLVAVTEG